MSYSINSTNQQHSSEDFKFNLGIASQEDLPIPLSSELNYNIKCGKTPKMKASKKKRHQKRKQRRIPEKSIEAKEIFDT